MLEALSITSLGKALQQPASIGGDPKQPGGLLQSIEVGPREQHRVTTLGRDLYGLPVVVDLLDQWEEALPRVAASLAVTAICLTSRTCTTYGTIPG